MEDKFKLDKLNIYLIIIAVIVFIILVITCIRLANSNKNSESKLPILETTAGKTSTSFTTTSTSTTNTTVVTTTINYANLSSPYYTVDTNPLKDEMYLNNTDLTNEKTKKIVEGILKHANAIFDTNDFSIFNTDLINKAAKDGEADKIVKDGNVYAELYNFEEYYSKLFYGSYDYTKFKYKDTNIIIKENGKYYRLITDIDYNYNINIITVQQADKNLIKAMVSYVKSNNSNVYRGVEITLEYNKGWKLLKYDYPI